MIQSFLSEQDIADMAAFLDNPPMTLIAAMKCDGYLLLSADSEGADDTTLKRTISKLYNLPDYPMAWGASGSSALGEEFSEWLLANAKHHNQSWEKLRNAAIEQLSTINGRRRKNMELAGELPSGPERGDFFCSVLIAGYIDNKPEILDLGFDGTDMFILKGLDKFWALGNCRFVARVIYWTLRECKLPVTYDHTGIKTIMNATLITGKHVGHPVHTLKITPTGAPAQI